MYRFTRRAKVAACALFLCSSVASAAITANLAPAPASPQFVGTTVTWTLTASDTSAGPLTYRFAVGPVGGPYQIVRDFAIENSFKWTQAQQEGVYEIQATVRNGTTTETQVRLQTFTLTPRSVGGTAFISTTNHPLVALYSGPACGGTSKFRVRFQKVGDVAWQATPYNNCKPGV